MDWDASDILAEVSKSTSNLILEEPFYGHFFVGLLKQVHEGIPTMAIGPSGHHVKLHINPNFWKKDLPTGKLRMGLIKHEILHVVFKHIFRSKDYHQKDLFNIACDLVVNQYIATDWLPAHRIHLGLFPDAGLRPEMDADYYYRKLSKLREEMENDEDGGQGMSEISKENLKKILEQAKDWQEKHGLWEEIDQMPSTMKEILEEQINEAISQSLEKSRRDQREWGKLPAGLRSHLEALEAARQAQVDWRRMLRLFSASSTKTFLKNTIRRKSKRYGTTPGIKVRHRQKLLVALDTSGSITAAELADFFSEIYHIWKQGAEVTIVECDMEIQRSYAYKGEAVAEVHGRGGTNFDPVLQLANLQIKPDAVVYFTDGHAPKPTVPSRCPVLWLITPNGIKADSNSFKQLPGTKVIMQ